MDIIIDSSAVLAVIMDEPERNRLVEMTAGHTLIGPGSIPWEIGNAFSSMIKQHRLALDDAKRGLDIALSIPIRLLPVDMEHALTIAHAHDLYAYDAYFLDCAIRHGAPLLTLDRLLKKVARKLKIEVLEV